MDVFVEETMTQTFDFQFLNHIINKIQKKKKNRKNVF